MYTGFYGLSEEPFASDFDARFFFSTRNHKNVLNSMVREITGRQGFILLIGEEGTGKTAFIKKLLQTLDPAIRAVSIDRPPQSFPQLMEVILGSLKEPAGERNEKAKPMQFKEPAARGADQNKKLVIITDNVQEMDKEFLQELAMLWSLNAERLQQVLVGRPEVEEKLNSWGVRRIKKEIALRCRLKPLTEEESLHYIEHRLSKAGGRMPETFVPEALSLICRYSGGIPRTINAFCARALWAGYNLSKKPVDSLLVKEILEDSRILAPQELTPTPFVERLKARLFHRRVKKFSFSENLINVQKYLYGEVYGFPRNPFDGQPDLGFYFATENCREVWNSIIYGVRRREGFILLTGESGVGKTTLLALISLYLSTRGKEKLIPIFHSPNRLEEILQTLLRNLGLPAKEENKSSMLSRINEDLIRRSSRGEIIALIFDEAQNLKKEIMEEILLLANFNPAMPKFLQVIFVGDMQFEKKLNTRELSALSQKFAIRSRLLPFTVQESRDYIEHRLHRAGSSASQVLTPKAMTLIAYHCDGIPRVLNRVCFESLSVGYSQMKDKVDSESVREALVKIGSEKQGKSNLI
jgi:type II secretory pathway predicted ATPase ExeA